MCLNYAVREKKGRLEHVHSDWTLPTVQRSSKREPPNSIITQFIVTKTKTKLTRIYKLVKCPIVFSSESFQRYINPLRSHFFKVLLTSLFRTSSYRLVQSFRFESIPNGSETVKEKKKIRGSFSFLFFKCFTPHNRCNRVLDQIKKNWQKAKKQLLFFFSHYTTLFILYL